MEEIRLWKVTRDAGDKPKVAPVETIAETATEKLLEEALMTSPELLMPDLLLVGRQTETSGGPLDLLGVDEDGRLVVFELKRGKLTREAVAQAVDYGSFLADLEPAELCRHINNHSGKGGIELIEDFGQWYQSHFQSPVAEIGRPRIMLVGLGVDECAKRMVTFLAQCELDISLITFHGFKQGAEILLARQVEVESPRPGGQVKSTKLANQVKLDKLLADLGIKQNYDELIAAIKKGLGDSAYQWPNQSGCSFYLPEVSASGGPTTRCYLALNTPQLQRGKIQIVLQARAIDATEKENVRRAADAMGSDFVLKPSGYGEIWIDGHKSATNYAETLRILSQAIATGWKTKMETQAKAEAAEVNSSPD